MRQLKNIMEEERLKKIDFTFTEIETGIGISFTDSIIVTFDAEEKDIYEEMVYRLLNWKEIMKKINEIPEDIRLAEIEELRKKVNIPFDGNEV